MMSEATGQPGRDADRTHRAVALRVAYRPAVTLSRWQRVALAALYGVDLAPSRGGRLLAAVLSPLAWLFGR